MGVVLLFLIIMKLLSFTTPYVKPSTVINLIMHVLTPPLVTPVMAITCINNSLVFVISFDVKIIWDL